MSEENKVVELNPEKVVEPKPIVIKKPPRGGLPKRTLRELDDLKINLKDAIAFSPNKNITLNLSWAQVIRLINFNADDEVLNWNTTFEKAIEIIGIFLM